MALLTGYDTVMLWSSLDNCPKSLPIEESNLVCLSSYSGNDNLIVICFKITICSMNINHAI